MQLEQISGEVISHHILPWLQLNDLLRLRRVSKILKSHAEDYLRLHGSTKRFVDVDPKELRPTDFAVPVSRVYIHNDKSCYWDQTSVAMQAFSAKYGSKITHLKVDSLEIPMTANAIQFFEAFSMLEHLEVEEILERGSGWNDIEEGWEEQRARNKEDTFLVPSTFQRLKTLSVRRYQVITEDRDSTLLVWKFINRCGVLLKSIQHPNLIGNVCNDRHQNGGNAVDHGLLDCVKLFVEKRAKVGSPNLKYYDLYRLCEEPSARDFYELVTTCAKNDVKLLNTDADPIEEMMQYPALDRENHREKIAAVLASLLSLSPSTFLFELPHLESVALKLGIGGISDYCKLPPGDFERHAWPKLRELEIWLHGADTGDEDMSRLLNFFFVGITREKMTTLTLYYQSFQYHGFREGYAFPYPNLRDVSASCPNLKKLFLGKWPGSDDDLSQLWGSLPLLEEVVFECCNKLGNEAFIGPDSTKPAFLQAKNLRRLALRYVDRMTLITDSFFLDVLRRMPLKELELSTSTHGYVRSFTLGGLASLLIGTFAETIEKLSFAAGLRMKNVEKEELSLLESKFRSADMI